MAPRFRGSAGAEFSPCHSAGRGVGGTCCQAPGLCRGWHPDEADRKMDGRARAATRGTAAMSRAPYVKPLSLSDEEMRMITRAAASLRVEQRTVLLRLVADILRSSRSDLLTALNAALREIHAAEPDDDAAA